MTTNQTTKKIAQLWHDIEAWYAENAPRLRQDLQPAAPEEKIQTFEKNLGATLPDDYRASLKIHDGNVYVHDYNYLSLEGVRGNWSMMNDLLKKGSFAGRTPVDDGGGQMQHTWWHEHWIPFAEDGGGNMLCIDMAPGPQGTPGQVLIMELDAGPGLSEFDSFLAWLTNYRDNLRNGVYEVDEDDHLIEKG